MQSDCSRPMTWSALVWTFLRVAVALSCVGFPATSRAQRLLPRPVIDSAVWYNRILPQACMRMPDWVKQEKYRGRGDTTLYLPERDRLSPDGRAEIARCAKAVDTISAGHDWLSRARVALALDQDSLAGVWHTRYLASFDTAGLPRKAWAMSQVVQNYADAHPPRFVRAQGVMSRLERTGIAGARARFMAHYRLMDAAQRQWNDTARIREARACLSAYRELSMSIRGLVSQPVFDCVLGGADAALLQRDLKTPIAFVDRGIALVTGTDAERMLRRWRPMYALLGNPAAPIDASRWFLRQGTTPKPAHGVVTVLHPVSHRWGSDGEYQAMRRFATRFADKPVELVAVAKTEGYFGERGEVPLSPAKEMATDSAFFYGYARMPGQLAIYETVFRIGTDGRRPEQPTGYERLYADASLVVVDRNGIVQYVGRWGRYEDERVARLVETLTRLQ